MWVIMSIHDCAPLLPRHHLKFLRSVMSGAVILSDGKQFDVIAEAKLFHERRDELVGGQASEPPVLGRDNGIEPVRHQPLPGKPAQRKNDGVPGAAERFAPIASLGSAFNRSDFGLDGKDSACHVGGHLPR